MELEPMLFNKCARLQVIFLLLCAAAANAASAAAPSAQVSAECDALVTQIHNDPSLDSPSARARLLQRQSGKCTGTGVYDASLASLFQQAGLYDDADRAANAGLATAGEFLPNLLSILALDQLGRGNTDEAYRMGLEITHRFPKYGKVYVVLAQIDTTRNRWDKVYQDDQKLVELDPSALSYMILATSLYQLKRYPEVLTAVNHALQLDPRRIGNAVGLTEAVYTLIILNRRDEAANLLRRHMQANPNWSASDAMLKAAKELGLQ
jgi:tetratricopeptide (TPR) repeat protein